MINNEKVEMSLTKGMLFKFQIESDEITLNCSPVSGKEVVKFNGEIVSEEQNHKTKSKHSFNINGNDYLIQLEVTSLLKGSSECTLIKNSKIISTYKIKYEKYKGSFIAKNYPMLIFGIILGVIYPYKIVPMQWMIIIFIIGVLVFSQLRKGSWEFEEKIV